MGLGFFAKYMRVVVSEVIFWSCLGAVAYNYVGYPIVLLLLSSFSQIKSDVLFLLGKKARRRSRPRGEWPTVAVLLSVYNEEEVVRAKVANFLELDYPENRIQLLVGVDASTDLTSEVLASIQSERLRVFRFARRQGKLGVLCALAQQTSADIIVTTDANTMLQADCIQCLVRHFADPQVGAVSGEETRLTAPGTDPASESLYWRYESALKFLENRINCTLGGNGSVLAVRRHLFRLEKPSIVEDFQIPLEIRFKGYRVVYDPEAVAVEEIAPTISSQFARRIRIGAGDFQALFGNLSFLDPRKGLPAFCFFSHRVLRWITPVLLLTAFAVSLTLIDRAVFSFLVIAQCAFYLMAWMGYLRKKHGKRAGVCALPLHFCTMNLALLLGLVRYLSGRHSLAWNATPRVVTPGT